MIVLFLTLLSSAAEKCPWKAGSDMDVQADMASVTVNGQSYFVRGKENRIDFENMLRNCEMFEARNSFRAWRGHRRALNLTAALTPVWLVSVVGTGIGAGLAVYYPLAAKGHKNNMIEAIEERR